MMRDEVFGILMTRALAVGVGNRQHNQNEEEIS